MFDFVPHLVLIKGMTDASADKASMGYLFPLGYTTNYLKYGWYFRMDLASAASSAYAKASEDKKTVYYYHANSAYAQANDSAVTYYWIAIG